MTRVVPLGMVVRCSVAAPLVPIDTWLVQSSIAGMSCQRIDVRVLCRVNRIRGLIVAGFGLAAWVNQL
jgi:hypothetical protein